MRILFINPNATVSMTHKIEAAARAAASPGTTILSATNHAGPASIQGAADGAAAEPGLLALIAERDADADAFVIACFDDTGLETARNAHGQAGHRDRRGRDAGRRRRGSRVQRSDDAVGLHSRDRGERAGLWAP